MLFNQEYLAAIRQIDDYLFKAEVADPSSLTKVEEGTGYVGYKLPFIVDGMNQFFGAENWRYEVAILEPYKTETKAGETLIHQVGVWLYIRFGEEWVQKGFCVGGGRGDRDDVDGTKAAITDGLKKLFSLVGIGLRAYKGAIDSAEVKERQKAAATEKQIENRRKSRTTAAPAATPPATTTAPAAATAGTAAPSIERKTPMPDPDIPATDTQREVLLNEMKALQKPDGTPWFAKGAEAVAWVESLGVPLLEGARLSDRLGALTKGHFSLLLEEVRRIARGVIATRVAADPEQAFAEQGDLPPTMTAGGKPWGGK